MCFSSRNRRINFVLATILARFMGSSDDINCAFCRKTSRSLTFSMQNSQCFAPKGRKFNLTEMVPARSNIPQNSGDYYLVNDDDVELCMGKTLIN